MQQKIYNENRGRQRSATLDKDNPNETPEKIMKGVEANGVAHEELVSAPDNKSPTHVKSGDEDADIEVLTGAISALRFVPSSVKFGRGRGRAGFSKN